MGIKKELVNQAKGYVEDWSAKNDENLLDKKAEYATRRMQEQPRDIKSFLRKNKQSRKDSNTYNLKILESDG
jgi:hypothetical protein